MPIYAYKCSECGHEVDVLQKMSDAQLTECPNCHRAALVKQLTAAGFQLKGSGWYATDFRNSGGQKKEAKSDAAPESDGSTQATAESKSDAKSDAKTATDAAPAPATPKESSTKDSGTRKDATPSPAPAPPPASSTS